MGIERKATNEELLENLIQAVCRLKEACMEQSFDRTEFRHMASVVAILKRELKSSMEDDEDE